MNNLIDIAEFCKSSADVVSIRLKWESEVRRLALETGLADADLSTGDHLVSDYGPINDQVFDFAERIWFMCLTTKPNETELS